LHSGSRVCNSSRVQGLANFPFPCARFSLVSESPLVTCSNSCTPNHSNGNPCICFDRRRSHTGLQSGTESSELLKFPWLLLMTFFSFHLLCCTRSRGGSISPSRTGQALYLTDRCGFSRPYWTYCRVIYHPVGIIGLS